MRGFILAIALVFSSTFVFADVVASVDNSVKVETVATPIPTVVVGQAITATKTLDLPKVSTTGDIGETISIGVFLIKNAKQLGIWGILSCVVVLLLSLLNNGIIKNLKGFTESYKRLSNVILSLFFSIFIGLYAGHSIGTVLVEALLISGGAMSIYSALKGMGLLTKKKPVTSTETGTTV
jgi:hypothetical protein